jgi:hypothetical protein
MRCTMPVCSVFFKNWSHVWSGRCTKTSNFVYVFLTREMLVLLVNFEKCPSPLPLWLSPTGTVSHPLPLVALPTYWQPSKSYWLQWGGTVHSVSALTGLILSPRLSLSKLLDLSTWTQNISNSALVGLAAGMLRVFNSSSLSILYILWISAQYCLYPCW